MKVPVGPFRSLALLRTYMLTTFHIDIGHNVQRGIRIYRDQRIVLLYNSYKSRLYSDESDETRSFVQYMLAGRIGHQRLTGANKTVYTGARGYRVLYYEAERPKRADAHMFTSYYVYGFYRITDRRIVHDVLDANDNPRNVFFVQLSRDRDQCTYRVRLLK